ncbi:MAG: cupredoxin domain-containing protein [Gammaproteobacteria bacterium]|nr:cupredoxin domain-containing protein [Gammaproteobacteria bacterium]
MDIFVNIAAVILILAIIWWFWLSTAKAQTISEKQVVEILLEDGVYNPARIEVAAGQTFSLRFIRKDASPCAEKVLFNQLDKSLELPLNQPREIELNISKAGEYSFCCEMNMYRGTLLVR